MIQAKLDEELVKTLKGVDQDALAQVLAKALAEEAAATGCGDSAPPADEKGNVVKAEGSEAAGDAGAGLKRPAGDRGLEAEAEAEAAKRARVAGVAASPQMLPLDDDAMEGVSRGQGVPGRMACMSDFGQGVTGVNFCPSPPMGRWKG